MFLHSSPNSPKMRKPYRTICIGLTLLSMALVLSTPTISDDAMRLLAWWLAGALQGAGLALMFGPGSG